MIIGVFSLLAGLAYFAFALRKFDLAVTTLPLLFPLYLVKFNVTSIPFTLIEILIYAVFAAYLFLLAIKKLHFVSKFNGVFAALAMIILMSILTTLLLPAKALMLDRVTVFESKKIALGILKGWIIAPIILFYLFTVIIKSAKNSFKMLDAYTLSAFILSVWALYQVITHNYITVDARASGPFESANYLALYITPALLYSILKLKEVRTWQYLASSFFITLAVVFSKSYAAIFALAVVLIIVFGIDYYRKKEPTLKRIYFWGLPVLLIALVVFVFAIDPAKWSTLFKFQQRNSSSVRVEVYTIDLGLIKDNWLTGIGLGQYPLQYQINAQKYLGHMPYELNMLHAHNLYLNTWLSLGLPGLLAFLWIIYLCIKEGIKNPHKLLAFGMFLVILLHGLLDTPFYKNDLAMLYWLIVAVILFPELNKNEQ